MGVGGGEREVNENDRMSKKVEELMNKRREGDKKKKLRRKERKEQGERRARAWGRGRARGRSRGREREGLMKNMIKCKEEKGELTNKQCTK